MGAGTILALGACGRSGDLVTVAVPSVGPAETRIAAAFEAAHPGVAVRWVEGADSSPEVSGNPVPDVWWGADAFAMAAAAAAGHLAPLPQQVAPDTATRWLPVERVVPVLAFNTDSLAPMAAPRDMRVLFHPRWWGRLLLPEPGSSTVGRALVGWAMDAELRRTGDEGAGIDWLQRLDAAVAEYVPGPRLVRALASGRGVVAIADLTDVARARAEGAPVGFHPLEHGVPEIVRGIAVLPGADTTWAVAFVRTVLGAEGHAALVESWRVPAPAGGDEPPWLGQGRRPVGGDTLRTDTVAAHLAAWLGRWRVEARGRGGAAR